MSAGDGFACAILDDDTLKCWGVNQVSIHSEIDGTTGIAAYTPTAVNLGPGRTAKAVSGGNMHQCAILDDDTLKCRGYDGHGALGLGNRPNNRNTWVAVNLGDNYGRKAKAVTCGSQHTCAMLDDDTVKCWGTGQFGTLGYGDSLEYNPGNPIQDRDAPEPTAVVPYIPHPDFTVEILDAERRSTLVTSAPMTSADGYLAEFNRAGVESIDWRYIIDSDVHSDSSYAWSDFVDQSYDWSGIKDALACISRMTLACISGCVHRRARRTIASRTDCAHRAPTAGPEPLEMILTPATPRARFPTEPHSRPRWTTASPRCLRG